MIKAIKNFIVNKRNISEPTWLPYRQNTYSLSGVSNRRLTSLGVLSMALRLYTDACLRFPLRILDKNKQPVNHPLIKVFKEPSDFQSSGGFFSHLVNSVFLSGNFHAKIVWDKNGQIIKLLPFVSGSVWAYPSYRGGVANDFSDPILIDKGGYFYKDYRSRIFDPSEILHIKDIVYSSDLLNGISRITLSRIAFQSGIDLQEGISGIAESGFAPLAFLKTPKGSKAKNTEVLQKSLEKFLRGGGLKRRSVFRLPDDTELDKSPDKINSEDFKYLKNCTDLDMARIFALQTIFTGETSAQPQSGAKESYRALTQITLKPWLCGLCDAFTKQLLTEREKDRGLSFAYDLSVIHSQDLREQSTYLSSLKKSGIMTANECRLALNLPKHSEGNELVSEKVESEEAKLKIVEEESQDA